MSLKVYKVEPDAQIPNYQTRKAACFDLAAYLPTNSKVNIWAGKTQREFRVEHDGSNGKSYISIAPNERAMIRTGLIFDLPEGYSMRIHPRSGMALKYGLILANCEGVIDEDYVQETQIIVLNTSDEIMKVYHGDRIAQGELVRYEQFDIEETWEQPTQKSNRVGGFGSTGKN
jgi:dUTP pyrophosphatase